MATPPACRLEAKHYILAAFTAGFIAAAVVTVVFVVLSPARIYFSVTSASHYDGDDGVQFKLTISANNTSRRATVHYRSMYVDVSNGTAGPQWVDWIRADLETTGPQGMEQPPYDSKTKMNATVTTTRLGGTTFFREKNISVKVTAVVRFKVGVATTRLYDIKVMCAPVDFFAKKSTIVACL